MILAVCVDDKMGIQFNQRRQSRDSAVVADLLESADVLWMNPDSVKLFPNEASVKAEQDFLSLAAEGEWCFVEDSSYLDHADRIEKIVLYRWNRIYPQDLTFTFPGQWRLAESRDFPGSSHEKITREVYIQ